MTAVVLAEDVSRSFLHGSARVDALREVSLHLSAGELVTLVGRSGSGKTTLLNLVGGLDHPDAGHVLVDGQRLDDLDERQLLRLRRDRIGFIFQSFGLLPFLSARENVDVPLRLQRLAPAQRDERVESLLDTVGLTDHAEQRPAELSGGEQQRVAIARALAASPRLLLADEPTGQLDSETGQRVVALLRGLIRGSDRAALIATHDPALVTYADRVLHLRDGRIEASS